MRATRWASVTCLAALFLLPVLPASATIGLPADDVTVSPTPAPAGQAEAPAAEQSGDTQQSAAEETVEATPEVVPETLTATGPGTVINGDVVTISGTLKQGDDAVANCGIAVRDASGDVSDSFTVTDDKGEFTTLYAVPEDQGDGSLTLTLTSESTPGATTSVSFDVKHTEISTASPSVEQEEAEDESSVAASTQADQSATAEPTSSVEPTTISSSPGVGLWVWLVAGLVGVGVIAAASTAFLIHRDRLARAKAEEAESLAFLDDALDPSPSAPSAQSAAEAARPARGLPDQGDDWQPPAAGRRGI